MLLKLGILGVILIIGVIIFSSEIQEFFPNTSTAGINSLKSDAKMITSKSIATAEDKIEISIKKTESKLIEIKQDSSEYIEEKISNEIPFFNSTK